MKRSEPAGEGLLVEDFNWRLSSAAAARLDHLLSPYELQDCSENLFI